MTANMQLDLQWVERGYRHIFGLDEAGRGPMAGPLVAAAVCLPLQADDLADALKGVKDSKAMTPRQRHYAAEAIKAKSLAWGVGQVTAGEMAVIDNMTEATYKAMERALRNAQRRGGITADFLMVDYYRVPFFAADKQDALKKGDTLSLSIAAASVVAKVCRDTLMLRYAQKWPHYGFEQHKGYPTAAHKAALVKFGASPIHRRNYKPVQQVLPDGNS